MPPALPIRVVVVTMYEPAFDATYRIGRRVVDELIQNWPRRAGALPGES
jgi:purine nucleoside permease